MKNPQKRNKSFFSLFLFSVRIGGKYLWSVQGHYNLLIQRIGILKGPPSDTDLIIIRRFAGIQGEETKKFIS